MAANDDFPQEIVLSEIVTNGLPSISLPAYAGITWVITDIEAIVYWNGNGAFSGGYVSPVDVTSASVTQTLGFCAITAADSSPQTSPPLPDGNTGANGTFNWSGKLSGAVGQAITVALGAFTTAVNSGLEIQAYAM